MKKLGTLLLGLIVGFLICYLFVCNQDTDASQVEVNVEESALEPPKGLIDSATAEAMSKAYNPRQEAITKFLGEEDNVSSWYSIDDVRSYLSFAEKEATEKGYTLNGIRLYLGVKPPISEKSLTTLFMVSTGTPNKSQGSVINFAALQGGGDIPGGSGLDDGGNGIPPKANYPQN
ncbi:MAG: hypothetical protein KJP09_00340 [Bacteroidia bacterium]|nr:hypothetical protein [Bacteroidia bacterium]MBT8308850.1 hypothetical protein [Bacteroidia bacterium]NND09953.1 hypothetical protein [Flavobacteriaceae bacterium]NNK27504.1 hypothetical protein [Flavobacteriaceae bacterium]